MIKVKAASRETGKKVMKSSELRLKGKEQSMHMSARPMKRNAISTKSAQSLRKSGKTWGAAKTKTEKRCESMHASESRWASNESA